MEKATAERLQELVQGDRGLLFQDVLTVLSAVSAPAESVAQILWRNRHPVGGAEVREVLHALRDEGYVKRYDGHWVLRPDVVLALDDLLCSV